MIEGLKVTLTGTKLQQMCRQRAEHNRERVKAYTDQLESLEKNKIEGMQYSNGDPSKALLDRKHVHEAEAGELDFIADNLDLAETYVLGREDMRKLGVCTSGYY